MKPRATSNWGIRVLEYWSVGVLGCCLLCAGSLFVLGKGEYTSKYLYTQPNPKDRGGLIVELSAGAPLVTRAVAIGRKSVSPYLGKLSSNTRTISFKHLPIDKYDVLLVTVDTFYEGIRLVRRNDPVKLKAEAGAIEKEIRQVEGFFEGKAIERTGVDGERAACLLQQWRIGVALAESAAVLEGTIHSIDLFFFRKPLKGWQLVKRRQLYREELARKQPFKHVYLAKLGNLRVVKKVKKVRVKLPSPPPDDKNDKTK